MVNDLGYGCTRSSDPSAPLNTRVQQLEAGSFDQEAWLPADREPVEIGADRRQPAVYLRASLPTSLLESGSSSLSFPNTQEDADQAQVYAGHNRPTRSPASQINSSRSHQALANSLALQNASTRSILKSLVPRYSLPRAVYQQSSRASQSPDLQASGLKLDYPIEWPSSMGNNSLIAPILQDENSFGLLEMHTTSPIQTAKQFDMSSGTSWNIVHNDLSRTHSNTYSRYHDSSRIFPGPPNQDAQIASMPSDVGISARIISSTLPNPSPSSFHHLSNLIGTQNFGLRGEISQSPNTFIADVFSDANGIESTRPEDFSERSQWQHGSIRSPSANERSSFMEMPILAPHARVDEKVNGSLRNATDSRSR